MKRIYTLTLIITLSSVLMAQKPCTWGGDIPPADPVVQISDSCYRVPEGEPAPQFNASGIAEIDHVWNFARSVPIEKHVAGSTPDPNFEAISKFMYDEQFMYILVVVSGDLEIDIVGSVTEQDRISLMFQNTWEGRGTAAEHCNDANFAQRYWEQDGDRKYEMPANRNVNLVWLDQDVDDVCGGGDCSEITGDDWLTYSALNILKYNTYQSSDTLVYEMAFHLKNWMKYSYTDIAELEGHKFGFDIAVRDVDGIAGMTDHVNLNDPGNDAYAWTTVLADFTFNARPLSDTISTYTVTFNVDDGTFPLSGVQVSFNSQIFSTDISGNAVFTDVANGLNLPYSITANGYAGTSGTIDLTGSDVIESISLDTIIPGTYSVTFEVDDGTLAISGAKVSFNSQIQSTNAFGEVVFSNVSPANNIAYSIESIGFIDASGTVNVVDENIIQQIHMNAVIPGLYTITFTVQEGSSPMADVYVEFNSEIKKTGADGKATFYNVSSANNLAYSAEIASYKISTGTINVNGADVNSVILMWPTAIKESTFDDIKVFPNPVHNILTINNISDVRKISIVTITGQTHHELININSDNIEIDMSKYEKGIYFLSIEYQSSKSIYRKIIKN